ncbi:aminotransferase class IV [Isosphaeraceae bacterium EP7]
MIWANGRIWDEGEQPAVSLDDRVFVHGLGLFETMRTWEGRALLLSRHRARLMSSAVRLGIAVSPDALPDAEAVARLMAAEAIVGDCALRLTLTGGRSPSEPGLAWLKTMRLPPERRAGGLTLIFGGDVLHRGDPLAGHKTLNYWGRRMAHEQATALGADEALLGTPDGKVWEGSRTNLFLVRGGKLVTPTLDGPILPGLMRGVVLERARALGLTCEEREIGYGELDDADELFLTNAVRGIQPVGCTPGRQFPAPGPLTGRLDAELQGWLASGGIDR